MEALQDNRFRYLSITDTDKDWGMVVTTMGAQLIPPHTVYPRWGGMNQDHYYFNYSKGRVFQEYQLIYITQGSGVFESRSCKRTRVSAGTMIMLFPGEWHTYRPDEAVGWMEYWVGFRGHYIDQLVARKFFSKSNPVLDIGVSLSLSNLYEKMLEAVQECRSGYQPFISSIVIHLLGAVYYKNKNRSFTNSEAVEKINEARTLMQLEVESPSSPKDIADKLGVSYSWFRQMFKKYTDVSPSQYQLHLKYVRAKELLERTDATVSEIAYTLNFGNVGQFSSFFRKNEGLSPGVYRKKFRVGGK